MTQYDARSVRNFGYAEAKRQASKRRGSLAVNPVLPKALDSSEQFQEAFSQIKEAQLQDPGFQLRTTCTESNEIQSICWQSTIQRALARQHNDVIWLDTTFSTNAYDSPLLQVCMLDENGHTCSVFTALMHNSSARCWNWAIAQFLQMTQLDPAVPRTFIVDQESAMELAIKANFQNMNIVFCWYHILIGIRRALVSHGITRDRPKLASFNSLLNRAYHAPTEGAFITAIDVMSTEFPTMRSKLTMLATKSLQWAQYSVREMFTCGKITTQVVEGAHSQLKSTLSARSTKRDSLNTLIRRTLELVQRQQTLSSKYRSPLIAVAETTSSKAWDDVFLPIYRECFQYFGKFIHSDLKSSIAESARFIATKHPSEDLAQTCLDICGRPIPRICRLAHPMVFLLREKCHQKPSTMLVVNDHEYECSCIESVQRGVLCAHFLAVFADCKNGIAFNRCMINFRWVIPAKRLQFFIGVQTFQATCREGRDLLPVHVQSMRLRAWNRAGVLATSSSETIFEPISASTLHRAQSILQTALAILPKSSETNGDLFVRATEKLVANMQVDQARNNGSMTTYTDGTISIDTSKDQKDDLAMLRMPSKTKGAKSARSRRPYKLAEKGTKEPVSQKRRSEEPEAKQKRAKLAPGDLSLVEQGDNHCETT
jgi:hypothetical protein